MQSGHIAQLTSHSSQSDVDTTQNVVPEPTCNTLSGWYTGHLGVLAASLSSAQLSATTRSSNSYQRPTPSHTTLAVGSVTTGTLTDDREMQQFVTCEALPTQTSVQDLVQYTTTLWPYLDYPIQELAPLPLP